jgi:hypothetical protein
MDETRTVPSGAQQVELNSLLTGDGREILKASRVTSVDAPVQVKVNRNGDRRGRRATQAWATCCAFWFGESMLDAWCQARLSCPGSRVNDASTFGSGSVGTAVVCSPAAHLDGRTRLSGWSRPATQGAACNISKNFRNIIVVQNFGFSKKICESAKLCINCWIFCLDSKFL